MPATYRRKYGLDWTPAEISDVQIELACAKKWQERDYACGNLNDPADHLLRACRMIFPPSLHDNPFIISKWDEEHAYDWTHENFCITWGCAASGKSNSYGLFAYLDWSVDPYDTYCLMASTTKEMLQLRSFESVNRYFRVLRARREGWPGLISRQHTAIINTEESDATLKASIKGVAVKEGSADESRANLQGVHLPYVRMIADELSQMKDSVMQARFNLMSGASKSFKFFGLCNPDSIYDLAGKYSTPIGGWHTVDCDTPEWQTKWGKVRHHNGFFSPAVLEPDGAEKYPHLINLDQINANIQAAGGNLDDPQIWTMVRGFPPPQGLERTVITETDVKSFFMQEPPRWQEILHRIAGLDPAFTSDGDGCVLQFADIGYTVEGILTVGFTDCVNIQLKASSGRPVTYQIADQVREALAMRGVPVTNLGIDDSGTQSVADIVTMEVGPGSFRVVFNSKPSELPLTVGGPPADEKVGDQITELYYLFSEFGRRNQIRGLSDDSALQFCQRRLHPTKRPLRLESKKDVRTRLKRSPDNADACAVALAVARFKLGVAPGASLTEPAGMAAPAVASFPAMLAAKINNLKSRYGMVSGR